MEKTGLKPSYNISQNEIPLKLMIIRWIFLSIVVASVAFLAEQTSYNYLILPPLIVSFVEFSNTKSGFRNRPIQTVLLLFIAALTGCLFQQIIYYDLGLPEGIVMLLDLTVLFILFERTGKFFAPAGAVVVVPMLLPQTALANMPFQVLVGSILFIAIAFLCFQKWYHWSKAQLVYSIFHPKIRVLLRRPNKRHRHFKLETEHLILRELKKTDYEELFQILGDAETMTYYPAPFSANKVEMWIKWNQENYRQYGHGLWAVILKENQQLIGDCGITMQDIEGKILPEVGYHINKAYWGRGYATEAAKACMDYGFKTLKYKTLYTYTKQDNHASVRVAEKNGMRFVKFFEKKVMGIQVKEVLYQLDHTIKIKI